MRSFLGLICLAVLVTACATRGARAMGGEEVSAGACWLPDGAAPGMFITWRVEKTPLEPNDTREETLACVEESGGIVTMERTETQVDGSTRVTATRFRRDGSLLG